MFFCPLYKNPRKFRHGERVITSLYPLPLPSLTLQMRFTGLVSHKNVLEEASAYMHLTVHEVGGKRCVPKHAHAMLF